METWLYTTGYQNWSSPQALREKILELNAILVDVRLSPRSKDERWSGHFLQRVMGNRYEHVSDFGNVLYKTEDIRLKNPLDGATRVLQILKTHSVVLMCVCWNGQTCHRRTCAEWMWEHEGIGAEEIPGDRKSKPKPPPAKRNPQLGLFDIDFEAPQKTAEDVAAEQQATLANIDAKQADYEQNPREIRPKPGGVVDRWVRRER